MDAGVICEPPIEEWPDLLKASPRDELRARFPRLDTLRAELIAAASEYTKKLSTTAAKAGLSLPAPVTPEDASVSVVMCGHQPLIYHRGLLRKEIALASVLKSSGAAGLNVVIDTDEGDAGEVRYPVMEDGAPAVRRVSIGSGHGLFLSQLLAEPGQIRGAFEAVAGGLRSCGFDSALERTEEISRAYQALAGAPITIANSIVRRISTGLTRHLEIPLSVLCELPAARGFLADVLNDAPRLFRTYNELLERHRADHKIKNPANPFPNLKDGNSFELPFWIVDRGSRTRTPARHGSHPSQDALLVPRGALITALFRTHCSDLFIHGTGGKRYESFTDLLIREYFDAPPPPYVIASETTFLFNDALTAYEAGKAAQDTLQDAVSHTERHLANGTFPKPLEDELRALTEQRTALVTALNAAKAAPSRDRTRTQQIGLQLKELNQRIRSRLAESPLAQTARHADLPDSALAALHFREFPFFLFPGHPPSPANPTPQ